MPIRIFICGFKFSYLDRGPLPDWCELGLLPFIEGGQAFWYVAAILLTVWKVCLLFDSS